MGSRRENTLRFRTKVQAKGAAILEIRAALRPAFRFQTDGMSANRHSLEVEAFCKLGLSASLMPDDMIPDQPLGLGQPNVRPPQAPVKFTEQETAQIIEQRTKPGLRQKRRGALAHKL